MRSTILIALLVGALAALPASGVAAEVTAPVEATVPATPTEAPPPTSTTTEVPAPSEEGVEEAPAQVESQTSQGASEGAAEAEAKRRAQTKAEGKKTKQEEAEGNGEEEAEGARAKHRAVAPLSLTPGLPSSLFSGFGDQSSFFIESFQIPPFLLPIFQAAGTAYGIPWQVLAAINEIETDYGRDLSVSSAGAEGWMQFLPSSWGRYGVDANGDGYKDPYNPADAIFTAARYLRAAGGTKNIKAAIFAYNHSATYVESVLLRAQLLGGTPAELLGAITGLTEARFPVHAAAHYSDGFPVVQDGASTRTIPGTTIYAESGAPVIAAQDGEVVQIGDSPSLGRFVVLRDAYGNTYVYGNLGDTSSVYPVVEPRVDSAVTRRISSSSEASESTPTGPATAGVQQRSPLSEAGTLSGLAMGATAQLESTPTAAQPRAENKTPAATHPAEVAPGVSEFAEGSNDVFLHPLTAGVQVIAGTVLGHVGDGTGASASHIIFQIRPAGAGAPLIDPKPILDGWVALENSSIFRAKGVNPFLATSPTVGQVLLESKQQLETQVLHDPGVRLGDCARQDVGGGRVDRRVLAALEYLSVSGLQPTVSGLTCVPQTSAALEANAGARKTAESIDITAINGTAVAGHQGAGTSADTLVRKLLMLQGLSRPRRIVSLMSFPGAAAAETSPHARNGIRVSFVGLSGSHASTASTGSSELGPQEWIKLIARLGEIPDPSVGHGHSTAAIPDEGGAASTAGKEAGGDS
ncbi:MAG TPA: lytic murein transglycosylase [Solirubrobacteraceae bacterium]|jgi:murein DD-endopeptidase MepM/ murein hydrolase activator NlpD